jgi:acyl-CoA thioester hydrolase
MPLDFSDISFYHKTGIQIRFNDIDVLNHVNNTVYQNYFDSARFQYFKHILNIDRFTNDMWVVLATIQIDFVEPIFIDDYLEVQTKVTKVGTKSLTMIQQIAARIGTGQVVKTKTSSVLVGYNLDENITTSIPDNWRQRIAKFERDIQF